MKGRLALGFVLALFLGVPATAHATFPGDNGKIAFSRAGDIWTMNPDGTGPLNLTNDAAMQGSPAWSPDGGRIAFEESGKVWTMSRMAPAGCWPTMAARSSIGVIPCTRRT